MKIKDKSIILIIVVLIIFILFLSLYILFYKNRTIVIPYKINSTDFFSYGKIFDVHQKSEKKPTEEINVTIEGGSNKKSLIKNNSNIMRKKGKISSEIVLNQAIPLTHILLKYIDINNYVWLEKTDGLRKIYNEDDNILDCEEYNGKLYCFDVISLNKKYIKEKDLFNLSYSERMNLAKNIKFNNVIIKDYYKIESIDDLISFVENNDVSPYSKQKIDGIIIQENNKPYIKANIYKLKRSIMNTIDFLLKYDEKYSTENNPVYNLYSSGKYINNSILQKLYKNINGCSLFVSPYKRFSYKFILKKFPENIDELIKNNSEEKQKWNYPKYIIDEIKSLINNMFSDPLSFDGKIVELTYNGKNYYPIRIRDDKTFPNGYKTAISNIGLIYAPLTLKEQYFEKTTNDIFSKKIINKFHENSHIIREEIFNKINDLKNSNNDKFLSKNNIYEEKHNRMTCLDLSCGRGGDLFRLINLGYTNLFCVDIDKIALVQLVNKLYSSEYYKKTWLNVFSYDLSINLDKLYNDIIKRDEYSERYCFNLIFINFAIHYLINNLNNINDFVKKLIIKNGYFIFTFFDGDKILKDYNNKQNHYGDFIIDIFSKDNIYYGKFPLPTIDSNGYREEPLVLREQLNIFGNNYTEYTNMIDDEYFGLICLRIYNF